ncbi:hypothetical protein [Pseudomonas allii]|uniref:Uncharacterized protein n=2 Tax=Pseudomonas allii TaxID=2740531 RepID=A0A7Y8RRD6_9PSED|nr:hypothetical protein [Pseudomonas allii]NWN63826.1 hypothetical protein [Pseudomonas allii]
MDDIHALALTWDSLPSDTPLPLSISPSSAYLSERQTLRNEGDPPLIAQLTRLLATSSNQALPLPTHPLPMIEHSQLGQWCEAFCKAINQKDFIDWANAQGFDLATLRVHNSRLSVTAHGQPRVYCLADSSAWWTLANPIIYISQLLDPTELGMPYIAPVPPAGVRSFPLNLTLAFHGLPMPANRLQAQTIVEELEALQGFPGFDDNGRSKSMIYAELGQQARDFQQVADALQQLVKDQSSFNALDVYSTALYLQSDSRLARNLKEAADLLRAIIDNQDLDTTDDAPQPTYYDYQRQVLCVLSPDSGLEMNTLAPNAPDARWHRLGTLGEQLGSHLYPDRRISIVEVLQAYAIERPLNRTEVRFLSERLRNWPAPAVPVVLNSARSFGELYRYRQYIGLLNDRHALRAGLSTVIDGGNLSDADTLDIGSNVDPDTLQATVKKAYTALNTLTDHPDFLAISTQQRIDPDSHVLLSATGSVGANGLDGTWKSLTDPVMSNIELAALVPPLKQLAAKTGGYLRSRFKVTLSQALRLYHLERPETLDEARLTLQQLAVSQPLPARQGHYWRALKPLSGSQPSAWKLSVLERAQIVRITERFLTHQDVPLFEYLGQPFVAGKSIADVRAEADFLMVRLLATPLAQQLADALSNTLHWYGGHAGERTEQGSRTALILAALILSLDPEPDAFPTRINLIDWHADYFWGEGVSFVRQCIDNSLTGLGAATAALAAHLLLSEKSPHLLVRDIPDATPCLSAQAWVLYRQYVMYMERVMPGSSRQLTYSQIMFLAGLPPKGSWKRFIESREAAPPVVEWAVVNGILGPQPHYDVLAINTALDSLNQQRASLAAALETFAQPVVTVRQTALEDLRRVYPNTPLLDQPVLMYLPENSPFSEEGRFEGVYSGPLYSFVDLHSAGALDVTSTRWHSTNTAVKYREMARQFHVLTPINRLFFETFDRKLGQLKDAYGTAIGYWLSHLTLPSREALEYGLVGFFGIARRRAADVGRFGVLMYVSHYGDRKFYEIFPRHLLVRPRPDLDYEQVTQAAESGNSAAWMRFDWPAYAQGNRPAEVALTAADKDLVIRQLDNLAPAAIPAPDLFGRRVPRTFDSPRTRALTSVIVERYLLHDGEALREKARLPITLAEAVSGNDPWADYLRRYAPLVRQGLNNGGF